MLTRYSATRLAELIRGREVSPVEVVEAHLRRIEELNPRLNAVVTLAPDAVSRARSMEAAIMRGEVVGALHGVPFTVKDTIETKGVRTTSGSLMRAGYVPLEDAPSVARLKAAGAILIGKTNVSEMAMNYDADNPVFGRTNNPHDITRTSGGSSGGCAAAVAACLSPVSLGSDLTGSVRVPAHFCGVCGLKPTTGRVAAAGHLPVTTGPFSLAASLGPMARSVEDLSLMFGTLAVSDVGEPIEAFASSAARGAPEIELLQRGCRVAWYTDDGVAPVTEETRHAVEAAARALDAAGLPVDEQRPPGVERAPDLWSALFARASVRQLREVYGGHEEKAGDFVRTMLASAERAQPPALDDFIDAWVERDRLRAALLEWMRAWPLILAPVGAVPAFEHDARKVSVGDQSLSLFRAFSYAQTYNVFGLPVACVPAGRSNEGLPIGIQIIASPFAEKSVLAAALIVERSLGGWQPPPSPPALSPEGTNPL
jgi:Asp-tRNA(Asn)/Glu-tRNA(Gln) amidotransferase A subunit family amidase